MPSHRTRSDDAPARYDQDHSDDEDYSNSALPTTRAASRGSRRDYDGESDSVDNTDEEDRKLEAELWDEEEVVGVEAGRSKLSSTSRIMHAIGKSGGNGSQRYDSVGSRGHSRSKSARSADSSSSRRSQRMNSIAPAFGLGGLGREPSNPYSDEKPSYLRPLSMKGSQQSSQPPKRQGRGCRIALYVCGAIAIIALVAVIVAVVLMKNSEAEAPLISNSTSTADLDQMHLSATGTDASGKTLYATISGSGSVSTANNGVYATSLNSPAYYPGRASEFDDGKYHSSAANPAQTAATTGSPSAPTDGLQQPSAPSGSSTSAIGSPTSLSSPKSTSSAFSTSTDNDHWYEFGLFGDDDDKSSTSQSGSTSDTSPNWSTFGGHGLGDSQTGSPSPSPAPTGPLQHGGAQQMSVMTWGTEIITVQAGGAGAASPTTAAASSTTSSVDWNAAATTAVVQSWGAPAPFVGGAATPSSAMPTSFATANFSKAAQPEKFQTRDGTATVFSANGLLSSCGIAGNDTDYLVAIPLSLYQSTLVQGSKVESTYCGAQVLISSLTDGATITAWVYGACTNCEGENSLDLSQAAYSALKTNTKTKDNLSVVWGLVAEAENKDAPFAPASAVTTVLTSWAGSMSTASASSSSSKSGWW